MPHVQSEVCTTLNWEASWEHTLWEAGVGVNIRSEFLTHHFFWDTQPQFSVSTDHGQTWRTVIGEAARHEAGGESKLSGVKFDFFMEAAPGGVPLLLIRTL